MTTNSPRQAPGDLQSGHGEKDKHGLSLFLSPGAEDFDPDSMVDAPDFLSSKGDAPIHASSLLKHPLTVLTLVPPLNEELQVAGFLHKINSCRESLTITIECLLVFALEFVELSLGQERSRFSGLQITPKNSKPISLELFDFVLELAVIEEIAETKALVRLQFARLELEI